VTRSRLVFALGCLLATGPIAAFQAQGAGQGPPQRPAAPAPNTAPPKSTAIIIGQVVDGTSGQPVPEAVVTLRPMSGRARGGGNAGLGAFTAVLGESGSNPIVAEAMAAAMARAGGAGASRDQRIMTGGDGRFVFHSLPPGQYQLSAGLNGYAASLAGANSNSAMMMLAGVTGGASAGAPSAYALTEGERLTDLKLRLWKYASVSGTVLDDGSEPAIGLTVQAMRRILVGGRARYVPAATARTDDRGAYRIATLLPADYLVLVPQTQVALPAAMIESLMKMGLAGAGGGGMDMAAAESVAEALFSGSAGMNAMSAMTNGVRIGSYMVASSAGGVPLIGSDGRLSAYQTAFFAGASTPVAATVITLKSGDERTGADLQLRLTPTSRVSGTVTGPSGPMSNMSVRLVVPGDGYVSETEFEVATSITGADGAFTFFGVPPGQFLLKAQKDPRPAMGAAMAGLGAPGAAQATPLQKALFAAVPVAVGAADLDGVSITMSEGFHVSGRIEIDTQNARPGQPSLQAFNVMLTPADGRTPNLFALAGGMRGRVNEDGTFQSAGLTPGRYFLTIGGGGGLLVRSATHAGRDVYDGPIEIKNADITGVTVTLTDRMARVTGNVTTTGTARASEALVILFPADYRAWIEAGMNPRRTQTARPGAAGAYTIAGLAPGDYLVIAIDRSDEGDLQDPAFIEALSRGATKVTVTADARTQDLSITRVRR
jgi:hypothetical protein